MPKQEAPLCQDMQQAERLEMRGLTMQVSSITLAYIVKTLPTEKCAKYLGNAL